ncbi:MAG: glycosylase, partial [Ferruginibacter sp.]|nr:glycosylase [Ferruginibacter sp.]
MDKLSWKKMGRIFNPDDQTGWGYQYSQVPWAIELKDCVRIYFTSRPTIGLNNQYVSYTFFADYDKSFSKMKVVSIAPLLALGEKGCFDEFGTMPCSVIKRDDIDEVWLYYVGWTRKESVPYDCSIGLAISKDGGKTFTKFSNGPLLGASVTNPFLLGCPRVYRFNNKWYMWYLAGTEWIAYENKVESVYQLKLATSVNGIDWDLITDNVIPKLYENECQTCASVFEHNGLYHLYFTYRFGVDFRNPERGYRIGYAYSEDLLNWIRNDDLGGINKSEHGWDSEMICYPSIIEIEGRTVMLHCGNY